MQTSHLYFKKSIWLLPLAIAVFFLLGISSCKEKNAAPGPAVDPSCVTIPKSKIQTVWVDQEFTKPKGANLIVWLKFNTSYGGAGTDFTVNVRGMRADNSEISGSTFNLSAGATCLATLPANIAIGSNSILLSSLDILESDGTLKSDFNYVKLTPQAYSGDRDFMNFSVEVVSGGVSMGKPATLPCPPCQYCRPIPPDCPIPGPLPDTTKSSASTAIDTTK